MPQSRIRRGAALLVGAIAAIGAFAVSPESSMAAPESNSGDSQVLAFGDQDQALSVEFVHGTGRVSTLIERTATGDREAGLVGASWGDIQRAAKSEAITELATKYQNDIPSVYLDAGLFKKATPDGAEGFFTFAKDPGDAVREELAMLPTNTELRFGRGVSSSDLMKLQIKFTAAIEEALDGQGA